MAKANSPKPKDTAPLQRALADLDAYLKETDPGMLRAMRPGVGGKLHVSKPGEIFAPAPFPPELLVWFKWHNGQDGTSQELSPDRTFTLMDMRASAAAWKSLRDLKASGDLQEPWELSWVPIMTNGGGDYIVFESAAKGYGKVLEYWHADEDRPVLAKSLADFARQIVRSRKAAAKGPRKRVDWQFAAAQPLKAVTQPEVYNAPVGTTYFGGPRKDGKYLVCVRVAPYDCWAAKWNTSLEAAFADAGAVIQANDGMSFYGVPGAHAHIAALLADKKAAATAKVTVAKIW